MFSCTSSCFYSCVGVFVFCVCCVFFFNDTATTEIYTRSIVGSVRCVQETGINAEYMGSQKGRVFVVDLKTGTPQKIFEGQENSFYTSASIIDKDLYIPSGNSFSHDNIYLAESYKVFDAEGNWTWNGKIIVIDTFENSGALNLSKLNNTKTDFWSLRNIFSISAPITASLSVTTDEKYNSWVIGGTGRYISQSDKSTSEQQYLFGFKDPLYNPGRESSAESDPLGLSNLYQVDNLVVTKKQGNTGQR
eukprot:TRINITY_DN11086_c0_g2_i1.p1 TRINITY_DN11086_c0_g2~~TRINITY_DN11086_c0_g2_i1.p1  ORF type:complete len:248 (-),score=43.55 TRINITY_DN11086_c0_g2_i1:131-874(-)